MLKRKFIIVAPLSNLSGRTRLFKVAKFIHKENYLIKHIGWERIAEESLETNLDFEIEKKIILSGGGYGGNKIKLMYFLWMFKVFLNSFFIKKNDTVWALGFESAFPLLLASKIKGFKIYFDDADRFSMLFKFPKIVTKILVSCEKITSRNAYKHIIPVKERYPFESSRFFLLSNFPSETEINEAKKIFNENTWLKADLIINANGWLGNGRGMKTLLNTFELLENYNVGIILVGKIDSPEAKILAKKDKVQYFSKVPNSFALATYYASDFVFTYYDPKSKINRLAASNKWGDAIMTGIGVIVNEEVATADFLIKEGLTISCKYDDSKLLAERIIQFLEDKQKLDKLKLSVREKSTTFGYFEEQLIKLFHNETK
jgi:glycosyltransferase involved in cell wall biosynthesis